VLLLLTDRVEDARWLSDEQRAWLGERLRRDADESAAPHGVPPLRALLHPAIWLVALPYLLLNTVLYGYTFWGPLLIRDALHSTDLLTGLIAGAIACATALVMLALGWSSDRTGERCLHALGGAMLCALGYRGAALLPSPTARVIGLAVAYCGMAAVPLLFCLPGTLPGHRGSGRDCIREFDREHRRLRGAVGHRILEGPPGRSDGCLSGARGPGPRRGDRAARRSLAQRVRSTGSGDGRLVLADSKRGHRNRRLPLALPCSLMRTRCRHASSQCGKSDYGPKTGAHQVLRSEVMR